MSNLEKQLNKLPQVQLDPERDRQIKARLEAEMEQLGWPGPRINYFTLVFSRFAYTLAVLVLLFGGLTTYAYSSESVTEGKKLYPLKLMIEDLRIARAKTPLKKVWVYSDLAQRRLAEAEVLALKEGRSLSYFIQPVYAQELEATLDTPLIRTLQAYQKNNNLALESAEEISEPKELESVLNILGKAQTLHQEKLKRVARTVGFQEEEVVVSVALVLEETKENYVRVQKVGQLVKETVQESAELGLKAPSLRVKFKIVEVPPEGLEITREGLKAQTRKKLTAIKEEMEGSQSIVEEAEESREESKKALAMIEKRIAKSEEILERNELDQAQKLVRETRALKNNLGAFRKLRAVAPSVLEPAAPARPAQVISPESVQRAPLEAVPTEAELPVLVVPIRTVPLQKPVPVLEPIPVAPTETVIPFEKTPIVAEPVLTQPDLVIEDFYFQGDSLVARVKNQGRGQLKGSSEPGEYIEVRFYDQERGVNFYAARWARLSPGAKVEIISSPKLDPGFYNFWAVVDWPNRISESDETNNTKTLPFEIKAPPGQISLSLAQDSPPAGKVFRGQTDIFLKLKLEAREESIELNKIVLTRTGTSQDDDITVAKLYKDNEAEATSLGTAQPKAGQLEFTISSSSFLVSPYQPRYLVLEVWVSPSASQGETIAFGVQESSDIQARGQKSGEIIQADAVFPLRGGLRTVEAEVGGLDTSLNTNSPSGSIGSASGVEIARFDFTASDYEDVLLKKLSLVKYGLDLDRVKLYRTDNRELLDEASWFAASADNPEPYFHFGNIALTIPKGQTITVSVKADIPAVQSANYLELEIPAAAYLEAYGLSSNVYISHKNGFPLKSNRLAYIEPKPVTEVSGILTQDTTWSAKEGPYVVTVGRDATVFFAGQ